MQNMLKSAAKYQKKLKLGKLLNSSCERSKTLKMGKTSMFTE